MLLTAVWIHSKAPCFLLTPHFDSGGVLQVRSRVSGRAFPLEAVQIRRAAQGHWSGQLRSQGIDPNVSCEADSLTTRCPAVIMELHWERLESFPCQV